MVGTVVYTTKSTLVGIHTDSPHSWVIFSSLVIWGINITGTE